MKLLKQLSGGALNHNTITKLAFEDRSILRKCVFNYITAFLAGLQEVSPILN